MNSTAARTARPVPAISDLPAGTLVTIQPLPQYPRIPSGSGVVVGAFGPVETASAVLVWFWGQGQPEPGKSVHAIFPQEVTALSTTLETMPRGAFESIARGLDRDPNHPVVPDLEALVARVDQARAQREHRDR